MITRLLAIAKLRGDVGKALVSGVSVSAVNRLAAIAMHAIMAKKLGNVREYGIFALCVGTILLVAHLSALGWHPIMTRLVAQYRVKADWARLRGATMRAFQITVGVGLAVVAIWLTLVQQLAMTASLRSCWTWAAICLLPVAIRRLRACELIGFERTKVAIFLDEGATPLLATCWALMMGLSEAQQALQIYTICSLAVALAINGVYRRVRPHQLAMAVPRYETRQWFAAALPTILGQSSTIVMQRADVLMIAPMLGAAAVGLYSSAARLAIALACIPVAVGAVMMPKFAAAYYRDEQTQVGRLFQASLIASCAMGIPVSLVLILFPEWIVSTIFSADYIAATPYLLVLVVGQTVNAMTGPATALLMMTGRERIVGTSSAVAALVNVAGNCCLIPYWGIAGAAWSTSVAIALQNVWRIAAVYRELHRQQTPTSSQPLVSSLAERHHLDRADQNVNVQPR